MRSNHAALLVLAVAGCGNSGDPLSGGVRGDFGATPFTPRYGVAFADSPAEFGDSTFEVEVSDVPVDCSHHLGGSAPVSAGPGLYAEIFLVDADAGTSLSRFVQMSRVVLQNHAIFIGSAEATNTATVQLTAATGLRVTGTVAFSYDAGASDAGSFSIDLNGDFSVQQCQP